MTQPFGIAELAARCDAALRRYHKTVDKDPVVRTGLLTVDLVSRGVTTSNTYPLRVRNIVCCIYWLRISGW
jgi:two-component system, OmpR family, KDP operon response regulator KdpE